MFAPDSSTYINNSLIRSPGYPLFIDLFQLIFGDYYLYPLIIGQWILLIAALFYFVKTIGDYFKFSFVGQITIGLFYAFHKLFFSYYLGSVVLSETLAFPLFMVFFALALKSIQNDKSKLLWAILVLFFLTITRVQFITAMVSLGFVYSLQKRWKEFLLCILVLPAFLLTDIVYHKLYNNEWTTTKLFGIQAATVGLYISDTDDIEILSRDEHKDIVRKTLNEANNRQLTQTAFPSEHFYTYSEHLGRVYDILLYEVYLNHARQYYGDDIVLLDNNSRSIGLLLIFHNFKKYLSLVINNYVNGIGGLKIGIMKAIALIACLWFWYRTQSTYYLIIVFILLLEATNVFFVALIQSMSTRYIFYTNMLVFGWILVCALFAFKNGKDESIKSTKKNKGMLTNT